MVVPKWIVNGETHPLPHKPPSVQPEYIIYREIGYDAPKRNFYYTRQDGRVHWSSLIKYFTDIRDLLCRIDDYNRLPIQPVNPSHYEAGDLDIAVCDPAYIILSLKRCAPWTFGGEPASDDCSISLGAKGASDYTDNFSQVLHLDPASNKLENKVPNGCTLIAFAVTPLSLPKPGQGVDNIQPINFHVRGPELVDLKVDPDIRYPGNSGLDAGDDPPPLTNPGGEPSPQ